MKVFMNVDVHSRFIVNVITMNLGGGGGGGRVSLSPVPSACLHANVHEVRMCVFSDSF